LLSQGGDACEHFLGDSLIRLDNQGQRLGRIRYNFVQAKAEFVFLDGTVLEVEAAIGIDGHRDSGFFGSDKTIGDWKLNVHSGGVNQRTELEKDDEQKQNHGERRSIELASENAGIAWELHASLDVGRFGHDVHNICGNAFHIEHD